MHVESNALNSWKLNIFKIIDSRISFYCNNTCKCILSSTSKRLSHKNAMYEEFIRDEGHYFKTRRVVFFSKTVIALNSGTSIQNSNFPHIYHILNLFSRNLSKQSCSCFFNVNCRSIFYKINTPHQYTCNYIYLIFTSLLTL